MNPAPRPDPDTDIAARYATAAVADAYHRRRFTGPAGRRKQRAAEHRLQAALAVWPTPGRLLDVPCGTGRFHAVCRAAGHRWIGADASIAMLAHAQGVAPGAVVRCRAERLPFRTGAMDLVLSARFVHHLPDGPRGAALRELARVARRGAVVEAVVRRPLRDAGKALARWLVGRRRRRPYPPQAAVVAELAAAGFHVRAALPLQRWFSNAVLLCCEPRAAGAPPEARGV